MFQLNHTPLYAMQVGVVFSVVKKNYYFDETIRQTWVTQYLDLRGGWDKFEGKSWIGF